jgi:glycosidase
MQVTKTLSCCVAVAALALVACVSPAEPGDAPLTSNVLDWRDEVIYQVLTDRFADGDAANNFNVNVNDLSAYHGGDWRGIIDRLDYLEELGVTAIWISPVVKNVEEDYSFASYHGYWTQDFTRPNPHFGDLAMLREMVDAVHARGMKVILDVVTNHVGQVFYYDINKNGQPDEFLIGQGGPVPAPGVDTDPPSELVRVLEWDPDFNADGIQAWTSLGPSGLAPIIFVRDPYTNREPPSPEIFAQPWAYNRKGRVTVWGKPEVCGCPNNYCGWDDECRRRQEILGDFPGGLKDIDTTREDVRDALFDAFAAWIQVADFDGFRIDTLKHVEQGFWEDFCPRLRQFAADRGKLNFFLFGEAFDGDDNLLGYYTHGEGVDSVFYFSQYYTVFRGALLGDGSRTCEIGRLHCRRHGCATDPCGESGEIPALYSGQPKNLGAQSATGEPLNARQLVVNFEANHDVGRLLFFMPQTWTPEEKRKVLHLSLTYLMTTDGVPSLYYGVEQEFAGGNDPANRETLWDKRHYQESVLANGAWQWQQRTYVDEDGATVAWKPFDTGNPTFRLLKKLIAVRKQHAALRHGGLRVRWSTPDGGGEDHGLFAFERPSAEGSVLVVLNLNPAASSRTSRGGSSMAVGFAAGTRLTNLLAPAAPLVVQASGCTAASGEGCLDVTVPAHSALVLAQVP